MHIWFIRYVSSNDIPCCLRHDRVKSALSRHVHSQRPSRSHWSIHEDAHDHEEIQGPLCGPLSRQSPTSWMTFHQDLSRVATREHEHDHFVPQSPKHVSNIVDRTRRMLLIDIEPGDHRKRLDPHRPYWYSNENGRLSTWRRGRRRRDSPPSSL